MNEKLDFIHIAILTYMIQSGVVLFTLPRITAEAFGTNGWISIIIFGLVASLNIWLISIVYKMGQGSSIITILKASIPTMFLYPFFIFLIIVWSLLGSMISNHYVNLFQLVAFPATPQYYLLFPLLLLSFLLIQTSLYSITKAVTVFFFLTIWTALALLFLIPQFTPVRFTPFIFKGETDFLLGGITVFTAFLGYELFLLFFPYVNKQSKLIKAALVGNLFTTFIYAITCLAAYGFFGYPYLINLPYPVIDMLGYVELPFIERMESLIFSFFIMKVITTTGLFYWGATELLKTMLPKLTHFFASFLIIFGSFLISFIPKTINEVTGWLDILAYTEAGIAFFLPIFLIIILFFQRSKKSEVKNCG